MKNQNYFQWSLWLWKIFLFQNPKVKKLKNQIIQKRKNPKIKKQKLKTTNPSDTIGNYVTSNSSKEGYYEDTDDTIKKCYESCK